ncbi:hypothetical protein EPR50_G00073280 [Perca flavescens]|uniref:Uncharacterized protein n=1 Tax=Perca flavescens TaxID=8167 RepID=A0A484D4B9_PERFV|nr:hypothetical protein EPR50_G00073280 [Perca flavescens]
MLHFDIWINCKVPIHPNTKNKDILVSRRKYTVDVCLQLASPIFEIKPEVWSDESGRVKEAGVPVEY